MHYLRNHLLKVMDTSLFSVYLIIFLCVYIFEMSSFMRSPVADICFCVGKLLSLFINSFFVLKIVNND